MLLKVLLADASERRHWMKECIQGNGCSAVLAGTAQDANLQLAKGGFDLVLVSGDFNGIPELKKTVPALSIVGIDAAPKMVENLSLDTLQPDEARSALTTVLHRYRRNKRIRFQTTAIASRAAGLLHLNRELRKTNQRLSTVLESSRRLFSIIDEERLLVEILQSISRYTSGASSVIFAQRKVGLVPKMALGVPPERLTGKLIAIEPPAWRGAKAFSTSIGEPAFEKNLATILGTETFYFLPLGNAASAQTLLVIGASPVNVDRAAILRFVPLAVLALRQARRLRELRAQAQRDSLTGLLNHAAFQRSLRLEVKRHQRTQKHLGVVMLDIDHFKAINDQNGHPAGDRTLKLLSEMLRKNSRETDLIARYGGEEFVLILTDTHREGAEAKVQEILELVRNTDWCGVGPLTLSAGIAIYPEDGEGPASLVEAADHALYAAKNGGRDRAMTYADWLQATLQQETPGADPGLNVDRP